MADTSSSELSDPPPSPLSTLPPPAPPSTSSPLTRIEREASSLTSDDRIPPFPPPEEQTCNQHHCDCCGYRRRKESEKIAYIFDLLRKWRWNVRNLMEISHDRRSELRFRQHWAKCESYVRDHDSSGYVDLSQDERSRLFYSHIGWDWVTKELRNELERVTDLEVFGTFNVERRMENIELLGTAIPKVKEVAPHLGQLLCSLDRPRSARGAVQAELSDRHVLMLSMMCMSLHRKKCTNLPTSFGMYMFEGGATKRVINTSHSLGICPSYSQLQIKHIELARRAEQEVRILGSSSTKLVLSYDNFEFQDSKAEERIGDPTKFLSITTAVACVPCPLPAFESGSIKQCMLKDNVLFSIPDFKNRMLSPNHREKIDRYFLIEAIMETFPDVLQQCIYSDVPLPTILPQNRVPPQRTKSYPLKAIFKSESNIENTQFILDELYQKQLGLKKESTEFEEDARIVVGDLKTLNLVLAVKKQREETAEEIPYDSYRWVIPNLGLFHLRMNMLQLIHGAHWGGSATAPSQWDDASTLQWQADAFGTSRRTRLGKEVQALEQLIRHSHHARAVAVFINVLKSNMVPSFTHSGREIEKDDVEKWLLNQKDPITFDIIIDEVRKRLFEKPKTIDMDPCLDDEWQNHIRFMQHVHPYLLLKWSIQHADLGLIRQAMRECCILFQAPNGQKGNYAREMIRYLHLVDSKAVDGKLADYILLNALVNPSGQTDGWYPVDQHLEFINLDIRNGLADRRSSYDKSEWIKNNVLNIPFLKKLQRGIESTFGRPRGYRHRTKLAADDIWYVANQLQSCSTVQHSGRVSIYPAPDLYHEGWLALPTNVFKYNDKHTRSWDVENGDGNIPSEPPIMDFDSQYLSGLIDWEEENGKF